MKHIYTSRIQPIESPTGKGRPIGYIGTVTRSIPFDNAYSPQIIYKTPVMKTRAEALLLTKRYEYDVKLADYVKVHRPQVTARSAGMAGRLHTPEAKAAISARMRAVWEQRRASDDPAPWLKPYHFPKDAPAPAPPSAPKPSRPGPSVTQPRKTLPVTRSSGKDPDERRAKVAPLKRIK